MNIRKGMLLIAATLLFSIPTFADVLGPGGTGSPDTLALGSGPTLLADTGFQAWTYTTTTGTTFGSADSRVYTDPGNTFCPHCLDFVLFVTNNNASADNLHRVTDSAFGAFKTDLGNLTNLSIACNAGAGATDAEINPGTVDRSNDGAGVGNVAGFNYPLGSLAKGDCTGVLVVETNATHFTKGQLSLINSGVATVSSFAPTAVPEPGGMAFMGSALLGAYAFLLRFGKPR